MIFSNLSVIGRMIFGAYFVYNAINHFRFVDKLVGYAASKKVPSPKLAVLGTGVLMLLGGLGIIFQIQQAFSALLIVIFLIPTTIMMHDFWKESDPQAKNAALQKFTANVALIGAAMYMF